MALSCSAIGLFQSRVTQNKEYPEPPCCQQKHFKKQLDSMQHGLLRSDDGNERTRKQLSLKAICPED